MAKTVRVLLHAGLGNQMFMYAAGRALALRMGARLVIECRRFVYEHVYHRIFLLDRFPIDAEIDDGTGFARKVGRQVEARIVPYPQLHAIWGLIREPSHAVYDHRLVEQRHARSLVLDGYWQHERYFADHATTVRRELTPRRPIHADSLEDLSRVEAAVRPVGVCIRTFREMPEANVDVPAVLAAYRRILLRHATKQPESTYFVATDQPDIVADPMCLGVPFTVIGRSAANELAPENLYVLSRCTDFFLCSSTFHWWAAWLSEASDKRVGFVRCPGEPMPWNLAAGWTVVEA